MAFWILIILGVASVIALAFAIAQGNPATKARAERRRRFQLQETGERLPFAEGHADAPTPGVTEELAAVSVPYRPAPPSAEGSLEDHTLGPELLRPLVAGDDAGGKVDEYGDPIPPAPPAMGRLIRTLDGERILTNPPFALRDAIYSAKGGKWVAALMRRLPPWVVVCPKVRMDGLVYPTSPRGRDPEDWRLWRQRVRVRAVDFVLADRRTWKPIVAVMIDHASRRESAETRALTLGGGRDRIIDEVLLAVGLPLVRASGEFHEDWGLIEPYVHQAILPDDGADPNGQVIDEAARTKPEAAVNLLRMDESRGWLLE